MTSGVGGVVNEGSVSFKVGSLSSVTGNVNGQGFATTALGLVCERAFGELGLHRLEAGTLLDNVASQRVIEKNGFTRIGVAPRYLQIAGEWADHILFQKTAEAVGDRR